jgi:ketosteroid isomerase-like protein
MSTEQNIQAAKAGYAAFQRGDMQGILAQLDENIEWVTTKVPGMPGSGIKHGHQGAMEFFQDVNEHWDFEAFELREFIASGDVLAVEGYYRARARKTGAMMESPWVMVWRFRNGKCVHFQEYTDTAALTKALTTQAAGA